MEILSLLRTAVTSAVLSLAALAAIAADYPAPKESDWVVRDFRFHTGEVMPELRLHYARSATRRVSRCSCFTAPPGRPPAC